MVLIASWSPAVENSRVNLMYCMLRICSAIQCVVLFISCHFCFPAYRNQPAKKKSWLWLWLFRCTSKRFEALGRGRKRLEAVRKKTPPLQALHTDCQIWKRLQVHRKELLGSKQFFITQALPSAWTLTRAFPDDRPKDFAYLLVALTFKMTLSL